MAIPRPSRPSVLWADFKAFFLGGGRHKVLVAIAAILMPVIIIYGFVLDGKTNIMPGRSVIYVQSWPADRSDEEIVKQNIADQKILDAAREKRRLEYQKLKDDLGIE